MLPDYQTVAPYLCRTTNFSRIHPSREGGRTICKPSIEANRTTNSSTLILYLYNNTTTAHHSQQQPPLLVAQRFARSSLSCLARVRLHLSRSAVLVPGPGSVGAVSPQSRALCADLSLCSPTRTWTRPACPCPASTVATVSTCTNHYVQ
jgi:hypothetical protein